MVPCQWVPQRPLVSSNHQYFSLNHQFDWTCRRCAKSLDPTSIEIYPEHFAIEFAPNRTEINETKKKQQRVIQSRLTEYGKCIPDTNCA